MDLQRVGYGVELDRKYVDVAVKQATLDSAGRTFDEIAEAWRREAS